MTAGQQWYQSYLKSDHWRELRQAKLLEQDFRCEKCKRKSCLEVHHKHYDTVGMEKLSDLAVLCADHHESEHAKNHKYEKLPDGVGPNAEKRRKLKTEISDIHRQIASMECKPKPNKAVIKGLRKLAAFKSDFRKSLS